MYPVYLKLRNRVVLVVGAGPVAGRKIQSLVDAGAVVTVVSPEAIGPVRQLAQEGKVRWKRRKFKRADIGRQALIVTATSEADTNALVYRIADRRGLLVNSVDDPDHCNFYVPAVVKREPLIVSISTSGRAPIFAKRLKAYLDGKLYEAIGSDVEELGRTRDEVLDNADDIDHHERARRVGEAQDRAVQKILDRIEQS